jgi:hypothetical protein
MQCFNLDSRLSTNAAPRIVSFFTTLGVPLCLIYGVLSHAVCIKVEEHLSVHKFA